MTISLESLPCHLSFKQTTSEMSSLMEVFYPSGGRAIYYSQKGDGLHMLSWRCLCSSCGLVSRGLK